MREPEPAPLVRDPIRLALAALAGVAIAAGGAPLEAFGLPWVGVGLFHLVLVDAARASRSVRAAVLAGFVAGFTANAVSVSWAATLFYEHGFMPWPLAVLLAVGLFAAQSLPFVLAGALRGAVVLAHPRAHPVLSALATAAAVVVAGASSPMLFPWRVGTSETAFSALASWAFVSGVSLVELGIVLPTALLYEGLRVGSAKVASLGMAVLALALGFGAVLHEELEVERAGRPAVAIGVAHTTLSIAERHDPMRWERDHLALLSATVELETAGAEVVLWPETAYPFQWNRRRSADGVGLESLRSRGVHGPIAFGAISWAETARFNSVIGMRADGSLAGIVDKRVLMPFSERVPFADWIHPHVPEVPLGLTPAAEPGALDLGVRLGILNCYEDLDTEHTRWLVRALSPEVLTNHTNDGWFEPQAAELHLFLSRLRAVETGRDLIRVVNGGVSAHIASTGEVLMRRGPSEPGGFVAIARRASSPSPFVRHGDGAFAAALGCLVALLVRRSNARTSH